MSTFTDTIQSTANQNIQKKSELDTTAHEYWQQSQETLEKISTIVQEVFQEFAGADPRIKLFMPHSTHLTGALALINHHIFVIHYLALGQHAQILSMKDPQMTPNEVYSQDFDQNSIVQKVQDALSTWFETAIQ
ncbi:hypothetical protein [Sulfoacidibacillus ferrooxidans]|uniref:Uncharacterized protein n=1 Tax=Sulfoacidibacillus ferrooxidans TaxID=2005001 RepID=A0A9X1V6H7_9BACL|nr:hypothetical protein [Sulfoacidibacillus ferrooxidans]MCI0182087.1 hypothetical protein [Sulfoacidibacillus ferrooxidans]